MKPKLLFWRKFFLVLIMMLVAASGCQASDAIGEKDPAETSKVQTIPPGTLTAISADAGVTTTPTPDVEALNPQTAADEDLVFWYVWPHQERDGGMQPVVDLFNRENPWGISVTAVNQGSGHNPLSVVEAALLAGEKPDVLLVDAGVLDSWYRSGLIVDLAPYLEDPEVGLTPVEKADFYQPVFTASRTPEGKRLGIPVSQVLQLLYYNTSWAESLGYSEPPGNMDQLLNQACAAAEEFQDQQGSENEGGLLIYPEAVNLTGWVKSFNGQFYSSGEDSFHFLTPEIEQAAETWWRMMRRGCAFTPPGFPDPHIDEYSFSRFNQREALLVMGSSLDWEHIHISLPGKYPSDDWKMIPFPGPDGKGTVTVLRQSGVVLSSTAEKELASWLFLKYLISAEGQAGWALRSGAYPVRKAAFSLMQEEIEQRSRWAQGVDLLPRGVTPPLVDSWEIVQLAVGDGFSALLNSEPGQLHKQLQALQVTADELHQSFR